MSSMSSVSSYSSYSSTSEITSSEYSSITSSFVGTQRNEETVVPGIIGYYQIDLKVAPVGRDTNWDQVEVTWNAANQAFTWTNLAGVSWTLIPISGSGGWDTSHLSVSNDNPYFGDGYTEACIEWVSSALKGVKQTEYVFCTKMCGILPKFFLHDSNSRIGLFRSYFCMKYIFVIVETLNSSQSKLLKDLASRKRREQC